MTTQANHPLQQTNGPSRLQLCAVTRAGLPSLGRYAAHRLKAT